MKVLKIKGTSITNYIDIDIFTTNYENIFNSLEKVKELVHLLPNIDMPITFQGETVLMLSCEYSSNIKVIRYLLEDERANPKIRDLNGKSALEYLFWNKDKKVVYSQVKPMLDDFSIGCSNSDKEAKYREGWTIFSKIICK